MLDISRSAGNKVIYRDYGVAFGNQPVTEVRAYKTGRLTLRIASVHQIIYRNEWREGSSRPGIGASLGCPPQKRSLRLFSHARRPDYKNALSGPRTVRVSNADYMAKWSPDAHRQTSGSKRRQKPREIDQIRRTASKKPWPRNEVITSNL